MAVRGKLILQSLSNHHICSTWPGNCSRQVVWNVAWQNTRLGVCKELLRRTCKMCQQPRMSRDKRGAGELIPFLFYPSTSQQNLTGSKWIAPVENLTVTRERLWQCDGGMVCSVFMVGGRDSPKYSSDFCHHYGFESWKSWVLNQEQKNPEGIQHKTDSNPYCGPKRADTAHFYRYTMKKIINNYNFAVAVLISPCSTKRMIYFLSQTQSNCLAVSPLLYLFWRPNEIT